MKRLLISALVLSGVVGAFSFGTTKADASNTYWYNNVKYECCIS